MDTLICADFEAFQDALQGVDGRYFLSARPTDPWRLRIAAIDGVCVMAGRDGGPNLYQASLAADTCALFLSRSHVPLAVNGESLAPGTAAWLVPGGEFHMRISAAAPWVAVLVPSRLLESAAAASGSDALPQLRACRVIRPDPAPLASLLRHLRDIPQGMSEPGAHERAAWQLTRGVLAVARSAATPGGSSRGRRALDRQRMIGSALSLIAEQPDQSPRIEDLAAAAGVSARTLNDAFTAQFGHSPHQYLMNRRLHAVHADLRSARPTDTVSSLCARHGIWDFGRFAQAYRQLFGLLPSEHLALSRPGARPLRTSTDPS